MHRQRLVRGLLGVAIVALIAAAAGCGGDDTSNGTPISGNTPTTTPTEAHATVT